MFVWTPEPNLPHKNKVKVVRNTEKLIHDTLEKVDGMESVKMVLGAAGEIGDIIILSYGCDNRLQISCKCKYQYEYFLTNPILLKFKIDYNPITGAVALVDEQSSIIKSRVNRLALLADDWRIWTGSEGR